MDNMQEMAEEISKAAFSFLGQLIEIADKYGTDRNEVVTRSAITFLEMAGTHDHTSFVKEETP